MPGSLSRMGTRSCSRLKRRASWTNTGSDSSSIIKSLIRNTAVRRCSTRAAYSSAWESLVPRPAGRNERISSTRRNAWRRPLSGGTKSSTRSVTRSRPTLSLLFVAASARIAAISEAMTALVFVPVPKSLDADRSTISSAVSSRSSMCSLTKGRPRRAVTFQSIARTSSPGWYSRTSENSMPRPLKTERYSPLKSDSTRPRVRSSIRRTCAATSFEKTRSCLTALRGPAPPQAHAA